MNTNNSQLCVKLTLNNDEDQFTCENCSAVFIDHRNSDRSMCDDCYRNSGICQVCEIFCVTNDDGYCENCMNECSHCEACDTFCPVYQDGYCEPCFDDKQSNTKTVIT